MKTKKSAKDENLMNAIELRMHKQKHSDFFFKLNELNERIEVYNQIFNSRVPKFMKSRVRVSFLSSFHIIFIVS